MRNDDNGVRAFALLIVYDEGVSAADERSAVACQVEEVLGGIQVIPVPIGGLRFRWSLLNHQSETCLEIECPWIPTHEERLALASSLYFYVSPEWRILDSEEKVPLRYEGLNHIPTEILSHPSCSADQMRLVEVRGRIGPSDESRLGQRRSRILGYRI